LNGPQGNQSATQSFWNNPAISASINAGAQNVNRNAAATGQLASGNTLNALQQQAQQTASGGWNNYVSALQPFLSASNAAAGGIANVNTGLGSALNQNQNNIGQLGWAYAPASAMRRPIRISRIRRLLRRHGICCWASAA
jgi:hypothetical protein